MPIHGFYKALFSASEAWRPEADDLSMPFLSNSSRVGVELNF